jgi:hypothetical protein
MNKLDSRPGPGPRGGPADVLIGRGVVMTERHVERYGELL